MIKFTLSRESRLILVARQALTNSWSNWGVWRRLPINKDYVSDHTVLGSGRKTASWWSSPPLRLRAHVKRLLVRSISEKIIEIKQMTLRKFWESPRRWIVSELRICLTSSLKYRVRSWKTSSSGREALSQPVLGSAAMFQSQSGSRLMGSPRQWGVVETRQTPISLILFSLYLLTFPTSRQYCLLMLISTVCNLR